MSTAVDWRRVLTAALVGIPCSVAVYAGALRVLEARADSLDRVMLEIRHEVKEGDARTAAQLQREIDGIRQDVRELRAQTTGKR